MKKEKFMISTLILIIGGALTKVLGMVIRIVMTRIVGSEGISLYMLVFPTFSLAMTLSQLGLPLAISKLVSTEEYNNKNVIFSIIPFSFCLNLILILIILIIAPTLSVNLLKDPRCYYPIIAITFVLPFDSLSSIIRGYFFGKQRMFPHVFSNIFEQIVRLTLIIILIPKIMEISIVYAVSMLIAVNMISELSSVLILFIFLPKKLKISKNDIKVNPNNIKDLLKIAVPTTGGRLIGSLGYFFEPIILSLSASIIGVSNTNIINSYGIVEGYIMPLLLLPSFFTNAISSALLPIISRAYSKNNIVYIRKKIKQAIIFSLSIGIPITILLMINPKYFLMMIYKTNKGVSYLRFLGPFFLVYYVQGIFAVVLQAIDKSKYIMTDNLISVIIRSIIILFGSILWGIYGFLISICVNILIVTFLHYLHIKKALKQTL